MDKSAIKNFATTARVKLIENINQKAFELGITKDSTKEPEVFQGGFRVGEHVFKSYQKKQYDRLIDEIREKSLEQVIEEVAYTWFNRFIAIRFMEVNEYLPIGIRVLSSQTEGKTEPDIIQEVTNVAEDLELDIELVYSLQDENNTEELFKYILIKQCNKLNEILPNMFEKIEDYTELLLPTQLLHDGSVIHDLISKIPEENWMEQVEIIGWLYQYYISDKKAEIDKMVEKGIKVSKELLPAKTQLFTPKWIVKYMVENSLGRLWLESHPNEELKQKWKYFLEEAEQDPKVLKELERTKNIQLNPEEIKVLDPCMGSGHILVYAFDVLYQIYKESGYAERDIPRLIIEKNLYGLDVDDRAAQLAYFAVMMKARSYNRRFFQNKIDTNMVAIQDSEEITQDTINYILKGNSNLIENSTIGESFLYILDIYKDAKEKGSFIKVKNINDIEQIQKCLEDLIQNSNEIDLFTLKSKEEISDKCLPILKQAIIMNKSYEVIITNPPYLGYKNMNDSVVDYLKKEYPLSKNDLFTVYMEVCLQKLNNCGYYSILNPHGWMFNSKYEKLRYKIINQSTFTSMAHFGRGVFGSDHGTTAFVIKKVNLPFYKGIYKKLFYRQGQVDSVEKKEQYFFKKDNVYVYTQDKYNQIPYKIISYWATDRQTELLIDGNKLEAYATPSQGMATADNNRFVRKWYEVNFNNLGLRLPDSKSALESKRKWFPYNNGGDFRKWYGNNTDIVNWSNDGEEIKRHIINRYPYLKGNYSFVVKNESKYFKKGLTWTAISSSKFAVRYFEEGFLFSNAGMAVFEEKLPVLLLSSYLNSIVAKQFLDILSPTMNYNQGDIKQIPILVNENSQDILMKCAEQCIQIAKEDWDSSEISWDFSISPLIKNKDQSNRIEKAFNNLLDKSINTRTEILETEKKINKILLSDYQLGETDNKYDYEITLNEVVLKDEIKKFISYFLGCLFGRYSLDKEGIVFAGGKFVNEDYETFIPVYDNVIPIADDEFFEDDIVSRFIEFVKVSFSEVTLEDNLDFIAEGLGRKNQDTSRQTIRRYFLKDFYKDHLQIYQKRPIYWLFESGKYDGFKALIYMHRYDESTVARVRTDYLHTLQRKYEAEMARQEIISESYEPFREKTVARKKKEKLQKQLIECKEYDQVIAHVANQRIKLNLDDGVKVNYMEFQNVEVPQGEGKKPLKANLLSPIKL